MGGDEGRVGPEGSEGSVGLALPLGREGNRVPVGDLESRGVKRNLFAHSCPALLCGLIEMFVRV